MKGGQRWHPFLSKTSRTTTTTCDQATDLLVLLIAARSGPKQDATIRAQVFFDHMKDFDYIVPNTISYNILVDEAYAKNGGDKSLTQISILSKKLTMLREFCWILLFSGGISSLCD